MDDFKIKLYVGDAPEPDMTFEFTDRSLWNGVWSQIDSAQSAGHGFINIPRKGEGAVNVVYNGSTKLTWIDYYN
jgi:hypothetical protein